MLERIFIAKYVHVKFALYLERESNRSEGARSALWLFPMRTILTWMYLAQGGLSFIGPPGGASQRPVNISDLQIGVAG